MHIIIRERISLNCFYVTLHCWYDMVWHGMVWWWCDGTNIVVQCIILSMYLLRCAVLHYVALYYAASCWMDLRAVLWYCSYNYSMVWRYASRHVYSFEVICDGVDRFGMVG